ncbi:urease accessory protein ureD [Pseudaestuariivita atlantica]|uniref:Urease accessory protein UreD n=1 Tax=Pseudaestuariivita atlantica TaxID=1317121 RepID=A0A0L1JTH1_9RHOB|nr:urease accessory protein ureD [Pseudaestuariivita atlantica]
MEVSASPRGTRLARLHQAGAFRALFPHGAGMTAVMLNTSGGVTGGDRFSVTASAGEGAHLTLTTQAAERYYRAQPGETGRISTDLTVGRGARIDWLPQETILFDHASVHRRLSAELAPDATLVAVEPLVFGRAAMGERVHHLHFRDRIDVSRDGVPVFADRVAMDGDSVAHLAGRATGGGAGALAALIVVSPEADRWLAPLRQLMPEAGGVSLIRPGVLFARIAAPDGYALRKTLLPALNAVNVAVPRTWTL